MNKKVPDITAYRLEEATTILTKKGLKFCLREISPLFLRGKPAEKPLESDQNGRRNYRVLKQTLSADSFLELVVAMEIISL